MRAVFGTVEERAELDVVGDKVTPLLEATSFEVFEVHGPVDSGPPPHSHPWDEGYVVLVGKLVVVADGEERVLGAGETVVIPAGTTHLYRVASEDVRFLVCTGGNRAGRFFADMSDSVPPGPPSDATMPGIIDVAKRNGLSSPLF